MTARPATLAAVLLAVVLAAGAGGCRKQESAPGGGEARPPTAQAPADGDGGDGAVVTPDGPEVVAERKPVEDVTATDAKNAKPGKPGGTPSAPAVNEEIPPSLYETPPPQHVEGSLPPLPPNEETRPPPREAPPPEPRKEPPMPIPPTARPPIAAPRSTKLASMKALCVTTGVAAIGGTVKQAAMRAVAKASEGDAASLTFKFLGDSETVKQLASGAARRQIGLKLRAENGCNLIYVMWRLDPKPMIDVSVKINPGMKDHKACGAGGYTKVKPASKAPPLPALTPGDTHTLRAAIEGDELSVWVDDAVVWRGSLPAAARELRGPAGLRSDNLAFDLVTFSAPSGDAAAATAKCLKEDGD
ncbi:MAG: hypothetical protein M3680_31505 [Myxococcota bacterium]|nr:hypothetical protein [Myxococcota bacterium]